MQRQAVALHPSLAKFTVGVTVHTIIRGWQDIALRPERKNAVLLWPQEQHCAYKGTNTPHRLLKGPSAEVGHRRRCITSTRPEAWPDELAKATILHAQCQVERGKHAASWTVLGSTCKLAAKKYTQRAWAAAPWAEGTMVAQPPRRSHIGCQLAGASSGTGGTSTCTPHAN